METERKPKSYRRIKIGLIIAFIVILLTLVIVIMLKINANKTQPVEIKIDYEIDDLVYRSQGELNISYT